MNKVAQSRRSGSRGSAGMKKQILSLRENADSIMRESAPPAEQWIKEGKQAVKIRRLSCRLWQGTQEIDPRKDTEGRSV